MKVLDLCSGTGGWVAPWREAGHEVITLDIDPRFGCDLTMDVRELTRDHLPWAPDVILASPPCQEFSRLDQPWCRARNPPPPDMALVEACQRIGGWAPLFVLENVRGAIPYLGRHRWRWGPFYLWGKFPLPGPPVGAHAYKKVADGRGGKGHRDPRFRAAIPRELADIIMRVCLFEAQLGGER